jgi:hypothetical protein
MQAIVHFVVDHGAWLPTKNAVPDILDVLDQELGTRYRTKNAKQVIVLVVVEHEHGRGAPCLKKNTMQVITLVVVEHEQHGLGALCLTKNMTQVTVPLMEHELGESRRGLEAHYQTMQVLKNTTRAGFHAALPEQGRQHWTKSMMLVYPLVLPERHR